MINKKVYILIVVASILLILPGAAFANSPIISAALFALAPLTFFYLVALLFSRRVRGMTFKQALFWIVFPIALTAMTMGHFELFFYIWAFYIGLRFCTLLLDKTLVIYKERKADMIWYGTWTGIIIVSSIAAKLIYWSDYGGLRGWISFLLEEMPFYYLAIDGVLAIPVLIYMMMTSKKITALRIDAAKTEEGDLPVAKPAP